MHSVVIAWLVRATHFSFEKKLGRPHEAGDDGKRENSNNP
jgi:hypothetical protein